MGLSRLFIFAVLASAFAAGADAQTLKEILRQKPDVEHGAELFRHCVACHGADGLGASDGSVPVIAGQHSRVIAKQLVDYRTAKRWDVRMERIAERHTLQNAQNVADVAAYASTLERSKQPNVGDTGWVEHGEKAYAKKCASCHGPLGEGREKVFAPKLAGQHYDYLLRQMYDAVEGRRPNLSRSHVRLLSTFVMEDLEGVADYLSRLELKTP